MTKNDFFTHLIAFLSHFSFAITIILFSLFAQELGIGPVGIGLLHSSFLLGTLVSGPLWGAFSDHIGQRTPIIVLSMIGLALSCLLMTFIRNLYLLMLSRFLFGSFFVVNRPLINILTTESAPPKREGKRVSYLNMARESAWTTGAILAGVIGEIDLILTFYVGFIAAGIGTLFSLFLKEDTPKRIQKQKILSLKSSISYFYYLIPKALIFLYAATAIRSIAIQGISPFLPYILSI